MNGEMNGTMDEPMETSSPNSPVDHKKVICESVIHHNEESNNIESSNELDSEMKEESNHGRDQDQLVKDSTSDSNNDTCSDNNVLPKQNKSETADLITSNVKMDNNLSEKECNNIDSDEEKDYSEDEGSVESKPTNLEDTVSINSDSESDDDNISQNHTKNKNDIIVLENDNDAQNGASNHSSSLEIHEILSDNDDCVIENDKSNDSLQLRRSNRAVKKKKYEEEIENGDEESDVEEVEMEDPLQYKSKPIIINDAKDLVVMAANQVKSNSSQKKDTTVVLINQRKSNNNNKTSIQPVNTNNVQSLYQSIVARGTTVTPISSKTNSPASSLPAANTQPSILPSLTDDMFVVEAPSFIVPYVYEKPSVKPFREFVDILGKELEEKKGKEEKEKLDKEALEKEIKAREKQGKRDRGEEVSESEEETDNAVKSEETEDAEKQKKKAEKKERRRRRNNDDDDDVSWDGESSFDSEDEPMSDEERVVLKEKADSIEIKQITELNAGKVVGKSDNYFDCSLGKFFINIGLNLVQEHVQNDLLKQQNRKLYRAKKAGQSTKATESSIACLMKNLEFSKENNAPYALPQKKCDHCSFKTESSLVLNNHLETPHMKNNIYKCNFCAFENRNPRDILYHMEAEHNNKGRLERAPAYHQCANCPFEDNGKGKLARHMVACAKKFKPDVNLAPPIEWEPPAKIPKITKSRNNVMNSYQSAFNRQVTNNLSRTPIAIANLMPPATSSMYRPRGRSPMAVPSRSAPVHGAPIIRGGVMVRHNAPNATSNYPNASNGKKSVHQPSISITPLPRQPQPGQLPQQSKNTFVICEICDGYIKDLEQLRNHMQWIHKVKIHPKMIYNRPPLNCQKCQFRFFTDQGLERHLLGSHGLVTSSMQEAANKGKDAGRCPVCGRVYQWKLLNHVSKDHNLTLKPAHLSYKCTVCSATFGTYKQFESHVYSLHSVVAKRVMDKGKAPPVPTKSIGDTLLKPLKINDEITIIPQPVKPATSTKNK